MKFVSCLSLLSFTLLLSIAPAIAQVPVVEEDPTNDQIASIQNLLNNAVAYRGELSTLTTQGYIDSDRLHVNRDNAAFVRRVVQDLNEKLRGIRNYLGWLLRRNRQLENPQDSNQNYANVRTMIYNYNHLVDYAQEHNVVFDDENTLGSFGGSRNILDSAIKKINLTNFDFTTGFAHECQSAYNRGIVAFRNPLTGQISWHDAYLRGIAVTGMDSEGNAILDTGYLRGRASAHNPLTNQMEFYDGGYRRGIAAVFNPHRGAVEISSTEYMRGVAGVYNPNTQRVEWRIEYHRGVAGYYDPTIRSVVWEVAYNRGVACIWREGGQYHTSAGFFTGDDD